MATGTRRAPEAIGRFFFSGMPPIRFAVRDVVDQVDHARQRAEDDERGNGMEQCLHVQQPLGKHQWKEDDEVLRPLRRAEG